MQPFLSHFFALFLRLSGASVTIVIVGIVLLFSPHLSAQIQEGKPAPEFQATDVTGKNVNLSTLKGTKVLLAFMRNAGCPVCNLRIHELSKKATALSAKNIRVVLVYESSKENLNKYLSDIEPTLFPFTFIADPDLVLYKQYGVEASFFKFMGSMFNGIGGKMDEGKKLFKSEIPQDGSIMRIPADFLLDENGIILKAHYSRFVGDHLDITPLL